MNPGNEQRARIVVDVLRRPELFDHAVVHHRHPMGKRHRLDLVMGDIDRRHLELMLQALQLGAHLHAQLRVEIGQRLVKQEDPWCSYDRPGQRHPLALTAGKLPRQPVQQRLQLHPASDLLDPALVFSGRHLSDHQGIADIVRHRKMRIERIGLEHHGNVAIFRQHVVHPLGAEIEVACRHFLEAGNHAHRCGLAAARGSEQHQEFLVDDFKVQIGHGNKVSEVLGDRLESNRRHGFSPLPRRRTGLGPGVFAR